MTDQEPTAWEDINPTMALAQRPEPPPLSSARLEPASDIEFRNELTACLALVVPAGMTEESRREWLAVAWATLKHLPVDLLRIGCAHARKTCDHPAKIVPAIIAGTDEFLKARRDAYRDEVHRTPQIEPPAESYCTPEQARQILHEEGVNNPIARNILAAIEGRTAHPTAGGAR